MIHRIVGGRRRGITFIEFVIVVFVDVAIIALSLVALGRFALNSAYNSAYNASQGLQCKNNLRNLGTAIKIYEAQNQCLPPMFENRLVPDGATSYTQVSFFYQLLPFIEEDALLNLNYKEAATRKINLYLCPVDSTTSPTPGNVAYGNYAANFAVFRGRIDPTNPSTNTRISTSQAMPGCSSSTIIVGERLQNCNGTATIWSSYGPSSYFHVVYTDKTTGFPNQPAPLGMQMQTGVSTVRCVPYSTQAGADDPGSPNNMPTGTTFQTAHSGVMNVLRGDGIVSQLSNGFDPKSLNYYCVGQGRDLWAGSMYTPFP